MKKKILILPLMLLLVSCGAQNTSSNPSSSVSSTTVISSTSSSVDVSSTSSTSSSSSTVISSTSSLSSSSTLSSSTSVKNYSIKLNKISDEISFHTQMQEDFLVLGAEGLNTLGINGKSELSRPNAINFSWEKDLPENYTFDHYLLKIADNLNFDNAWEYEVSNTQLDVYNLKVGTQYYWSVQTVGGEETYLSEISTFTTAYESPRNIYVDGITNVRDIGGWIIDDHTRVKQGLAYRCGRLNESSSDSLKIEITDDGISQMKNYLGIKSEIDLRLVNDNEVGKYTSSALGEDVNYYQCPMSYNGNYLENNKLMVKNVFDLLSDTNNYPLIYHCNIGTDRTGLVTYMLNGLLGVDQEDLFMDYEFSNLGKIDGTRSRNSLKSNYVNTINKVEGDSLSEKVANYLLSIGINQMQIDTIVDLFTEEY